MGGWVNDMGGMGGWVGGWEETYREDFVLALDGLIEDVVDLFGGGTDLGGWVGGWVGCMFR